MVNPYSSSKESKKNQVRHMFDNISGRYDLLNRILSLGIDKIWRKKLLSFIELENGPILDLACGTGDVSFSLARKFPTIEIIGADLSKGMIEFAQKRKKGQFPNLSFRIEDAENLSFKNQSFEVLTIAFGVRNFENLEQGLQEMHRVLKDDGTMIVLEFSKPNQVVFKRIFNLYFKNVLPLLGKWISGDSSAYKYLFESVQDFPFGEKFCRLLKDLDFCDVDYYQLTGGICSIYLAKK